MRIGPHRPYRLHSHPFVVVVGISVDKENTDRLSALGPQLPRSLRDLGRVDRHRAGPVCEHPLIHFEAEIASNQRGKGTPQAPGVGPVPSPHFQHIPKAPGRDQTGPGTFSLKQRIGRNRRPVHDRGHVRKPPEGSVDALLNTPGLIIPRGGHLNDLACAIYLVEKEHISKRAANINTNNDSFSSCTHHLDSVLLRILAGTCRHITEPDVFFQVFRIPIFRFPEPATARRFEANALILLQLDPNNLRYQFR